VSADANPLVNSRKEPTSVKFFKASPPGPRLNNGKIQTAGPPPRRHRTRLFSRLPRTLHARSTPRAPRRHDRSILTAVPAPSQTPHALLFTPLTFAARLLQHTCPQTPRSQHSDSWPGPLTDASHVAFHAALLLCKLRPPHLPPGAPISAFCELSHPLTHTADATFDAAHLCCTPG